MDLIHDYLDKLIEARAATIEQAIEAALQGGEHGVSVIDIPGNTSARVDPRVPYGHQFTFPSLSAYHKWIENGCPK